MNDRSRWLLVLVFSVCFSTTQTSFGVDISGTLHNLDTTLLNRPAGGAPTNVVAEIRVSLRDVNRVVRAVLPVVNSNPAGDTFTVTIQPTDIPAGSPELFVDMVISAPGKQSATLDGLALLTQEVRVTLPKQVASAPCYRRHCFLRFRRR